MAAISYSITVGQTQEQITTGTNAPSGGAGTIELRMDQTASTVTDGASTRILKKGEIYALIKILKEYLIRDTNVFE